MVRNDEQSQKNLHVAAAGHGKRIIYKQLNANEAPVVIN